MSHVLSRINSVVIGTVMLLSVMLSDTTHIGNLSLLLLGSAPLILMGILDWHPLSYLATKFKFKSVVKPGFSFKGINSLAS